MTARFKHDAGWLYAALTVADDSIGQKTASFFFDDNHDGIKDPGEDAVIVGVDEGNVVNDYYYSPTGSQGENHYNDADSGGSDPPCCGTDDVVAEATESGGQVSFEFRHPLCTEDVVFDFCVDVGGSLGLQLEYETGGTAAGYPGASEFDPSDWADLSISPEARGHQPDRLRVESSRGSRDLPDERRRLGA